MVLIGTPNDMISRECYEPNDSWGTPLCIIFLRLQNDNLYMLIKSDFLIGVTRTKRATLQIWGTPWAGVEVVVVAI